MPSEYDQSEPDYSLAGASPTAATPATAEDHPMFAKAPYLDLQAGPVTLERLLALFSKRAGIEAAKAKLRGRTNAVRGWQVRI